MMALGRKLQSASVPHNADLSRNVLEPLVRLR
jgi:hypothetical protein